MRSSSGVSRACKIAGVLAVALVLAACARQAQPQQYGVGGEAPAEPGTSRDFAVNVGDVVHFEVDSSALTGEAQGILRNQARWLNQYPQYTVTVEGHADERGTREYNIALGAKRATAVKGFLAGQGVSAAPDAHHLLRQGAADRGLRRHLLLVAEQARPDGLEQSGHGGELIGRLKSGGWLSGLRPGRSQFGLKRRSKWMGARLCD